MPRPDEAQPFVKWAGGKRQLLPQLRWFYPATFARYMEPFLGSGAVFFDLWSAGRLPATPCLLSDANPDLIGTYLRVRDSTDELVDALRRLAAAHARHGRDHYYVVRDRRFNPARLSWQRSGCDPGAYPTRLAAMLIYLNRTGYNGLFRLNRAGGFNVPAGSYLRPAILQEDRIRRAAVALRSSAVELRCAPFHETLAEARSGDFIYLDPPYAPLSVTANFRSYTARGFESADQRRLRDAVVDAARAGAAVLLSNSTAPEVIRLYEDVAVRRAGLRALRVPARRAINSRASGRSAIEELLVTNVPESGAAD